MKAVKLVGGLAAGMAMLVASSTASVPRADLAEARARVAAAIEFAPPTEAAVIVRQPDGKTFRAHIAPARFGGNLEVDGYTVVKGADGWWRYARTRDEQGRLVATAVIAGRGTPPAKLSKGVGRKGFTGTETMGAQQLMAEQLTRAAGMAAKRRAAAAAGEPVVFRFPVLLLATWWDADAGQTAPQFQPGSDNITHFKNILDGFGGNPFGSLTEFYFENSYGQFLVKVDVYGPYVSQRSRQDRCYYGGTDQPPTYTDDLDPMDNVFGVGGLGAAGMAVEAVPQADPLVDFSVYDNDGDGYVDFMGIVHSGADMATTGDPCNTWSHALPISRIGDVAEGLLGLPTDTARGGVPTLDGVNVDRVFTMPEFAEAGATLAIGVATHEMAHALGEPDYYAVNGTSSGDGDWDIMSGGSYLGNPSGTNPSWFNPATRVYQGWTTPTIVHESRTNVHLQPRETPMPGYVASTPNPNLILVPTRWIKLGETDANGHTWTDHDVHGLVLDGDRGYVVEGWYLEYASKMAGPQAAIHDGMSRSPYNDRGIHGSGLLSWHFDYWRRSNTYWGSNNAQDDSNRMQMDVEEFDFYDNSQDIARNLHRGEASDPFIPTATGMTSGTHQIPPGVSEVPGTPQADIALSGTTTASTPADAEFTVDDNPANYNMTVRIVGDGPPPGDCKLQLFRHDGDQLKAESNEADSGSVGDEEVVVVTKPTPGAWVARVSDFAGCTAWTGSVHFEAPGGFDSRGSADTWSNDTQQPTGWAFTNIRGGVAQGVEFAGDTVGPRGMTLDILQLAELWDVSPGYARPARQASGGRRPVIAGRDINFTVPIFSNGGRTPGRVRVAVYEGRGRSGAVVARGGVTLAGYERRNFNFVYHPRKEGPYELTVVVDPGNLIIEASEDNNAQVVSGWAGPRNPQVLVVDDEGYTDGEDAYIGALAALGIPYAVATDGHASADMMARYAAVIWVGAIDRGPGQLHDGDRAAIASYLAGGGKLWLASNRAAGALDVEGTTDFLAGWFGGHTLETTTLEQAHRVTASAEFGGSSFDLQPYPIRPFSDLVEVASSGVFGAAAQIMTLTESHKPGRDGAGFGVRVIGDEAHGSFRSVLTPFSLGQASTADTAVALTRKVMEFFGVPTGQYVAGGTTPLIYHVTLRQRDSGIRAPVTAIVLGGAPGTAVNLHRRRHGTPDYVVQALTAGAEPGVYNGAIAAGAVTPAGIDYYLEAGNLAFDPPLAAGGRLNHAIAVSIPEVTRR